MPDSPSDPNQSTRRRFQDWGFQARYEFRTWCGRSSALFSMLHGRRPFNRDHLVGRGTDICIEGFPRSANSYAVLKLAEAQRRSIQIAHHLHVPIQIQRAVQWGIPTLVLVRSPQDAVTSLLIRHPELAVSQVLRAYSIFHESILPLRDQFVIGDFSEVTRDLGAVIGRVNEQFGTQFHVPCREPKSDLRIFEQLDVINSTQGSTHGEHAVSRPSTLRDAQKEFFMNQLKNGRNVRSLIRAEGLYEQFAYDAGRRSTVPSKAA